MTDYARSRLGPAGISNADFMTCDLQTDKLEADMFDAAFSRFGVMFFDQPVIGFSNIRTAMKSGAPLAFVCWQTPRENLWHSLAVATAKNLSKCRRTTARARPVRLCGCGLCDLHSHRCRLWRYCH